MNNVFDVAAPGITNCPRTLAIESSCDDFCFALLHGDKIIWSRVISQKHEGGVYPEKASRMHVQALPELLKSLSEKFDLVAVTLGPGLLGSLQVGLIIAKTISWLYEVPLVVVDHIDAHILTPFWACQDNPIRIPYLCIVASGGHTLIAHVEGTADISILGSTRDDAAGEALDKIGRMLGLPYPAGPEIERWASLGRPSIKLPIPMKLHPGCEISFSGLKEHARSLLRANPVRNDRDLADWASSVQHAVGEALCAFLEKALRITGCKQVGFSGGVASNMTIRSMLSQVCAKHFATLHCPPGEFCRDNASMIAWCGKWAWERGEIAGLDALPRQRYSRMRPNMTVS